MRASATGIVELAFCDPPTGLADRRALDERRTHGFLPRLRFKPRPIDLPRFRPVNDTPGHAVGHSPLGAVAERSTTMVGPNGFAARQGDLEPALPV